METSPGSEPLIPPNFLSPSAPSLQSSIQSHTKPALSPALLAASASHPTPLYDTSVFRPNTDMFITQLSSPVTPPVVFTNNPVNVKCPHCHLQVTTQVKFETKRYSNPEYICELAYCWLVCCLRFACCPLYRHTCPNCKRILGRGRK